MLNDIKIRYKLSILLVIALAGILILGILGVIKLSKVNKGLESVYNDRVVPLKQLKVIADEYAVNIVDTTHQTRNGNFSFDKCISNIDSADKKIKKQWKAYMSTSLTKEEEKLAADVQRLMVVGDEIALKIKNTCQKGDLELLSKITIEDLYPKIDPIGEKISALISLQLTEAKNETQKAFDIYETSKTTVIISIVVLTIILLTLAYFIISDITKKLDVFKNGLLSFFSYLNRETSQSHLINIKSKDEFGEMAILVDQNIAKTQDMIKSDDELIKDAQVVMRRVNNGWYSQLIEKRTSNLALEEFKNDVNEMITNTKNRFISVNDVLDEYSHNDYRKKLELKDTDEKDGVFEALLNRINMLQETITNLLIENKSNGMTLDESSNILLTNVDKLNVSSNEAAASLEETAAALEEITSNIRNNTENIAQMAKYSSNVTQSAQNGENLANQTTSSMDDINNQVDAINEAITVIDQIAFQTNILSLNAAVEAATAGEAGKGFAVVAQEVRNLASRSAEAAKEIKDIVEVATSKANQGKEIANHMINGYKELNTNIQQTINLIQDIEMSSKEQLNGIEQINTAVTQLDQQTQQNAQISSQTNDIAILTDNIAKLIVNNANEKEFNGKDSVKTKDLEHTRRNNYEVSSPKVTPKKVIEAKDDSQDWESF